jgi:oligopeptide transport system permease protein
MLPVLVRRVFLEALPTLLFLLAATFVLLRLVPGGPFDGDRAWPPEIKRHLEARYGLDQPVPEQLARWLKGVAKGDLGESLEYLDRPVTGIIAEALPVSLLLGSAALALSVSLGVLIGGVSAWKKDTWADRSLSLAMMVGLSLPAYLPASLLILLFALWLGWFPPARWDEASSAVLPVLTLAIRPTAIIARLTRAEAIEALGADYVRTALGKGLSVRAAVFRHALRNSLIPVLSQLGQIAAHLMTGSFLVETIFQIPGLGTHFVQAVLNRDYPLVMGLTLVYGTALILCNLAVDFAYTWADPRIRLDIR